ncbi:MAG: hypothetical protein ABI743_10940 [bacterium]
MSLPWWLGCLACLTLVSVTPVAAKPSNHYTSPYQSVQAERDRETITAMVAASLGPHEVLGPAIAAEWEVDVPPCWAVAVNDDPFHISHSRARLQIRSVGERKTPSTLQQTIEIGARHPESQWSYIYRIVASQQDQSALLFVMSEVQLAATHADTCTLTVLRYDRLQQRWVTEFVDDFFAGTIWGVTQFPGSANPVYFVHDWRNSSYRHDWESIPPAERIDDHPILGDKLDVIEEVDGHYQIAGEIRLDRLFADRSAIATVWHSTREVFPDLITTRLLQQDNWRSLMVPFDINS